MSWPDVALISTVLLLAVTTYGVWCLNGLETAKGKRDGLRIEAESELAKAVGAKLAEVDKLRNEVASIRMQIPRK